MVTGSTNYTAWPSLLTNKQKNNQQNKTIKTVSKTGCNSTNRDQSLVYCLNCVSVLRLSDNDNSFLTFPQLKINREICDIFSGIITFSWVLRGVAASPLPFYHFSNTPELWCHVRIESTAFSRTGKINATSARAWFVKAILCFGGSWLRLPNQPKVHILKRDIKTNWRTGTFFPRLLGGLSLSVGR